MPELQEIVNAAMSEAMKRTDNNHQADYVALERHRPTIEVQPVGRSPSRSRDPTATGAT